MSRRRKKNQLNLSNPVQNLDKGLRTVSVEEFRTNENLQRRLYELERLVEELGATWSTVHNHLCTDLQIDSVGNEIGSIADQLKDTLRVIRYGNQKHKKSGKANGLTKISGNSQHHQSPVVNGGKPSKDKEVKSKDRVICRYCDVKLEFIVCIGDGDLKLEAAKKS